MHAGSSGAVSCTASGTGTRRCSMRPPGSTRRSSWNATVMRTHHPTSSWNETGRVSAGRSMSGDQKLMCRATLGCAARRVSSCCERMSSSKTRGGFSEELLSKSASRNVFPQVRRDGDGGRQSLRCDAELGVSAFGRGHGETAEAVPGAQPRRVPCVRDVPRHGSSRRSGIRGRARCGP